MSIFGFLIAEKKYDPYTDPDSFGNIAIEKSYITRDELLSALDKQEERLPLGEILISMGKLTAWQRDEILIEQEKRKAKSPNELSMLELKKQRQVIHHIRRQMDDLSNASKEFIEAVNGVEVEDKVGS